MSLRITQGILFSRALQDIRNSQLGFARIQQQAATGRRVNAPSDDPVATLRIMPLTAELRNLDQLLGNNQLARESMNSAAAGLETASSIMQRIRELTIQAANGTLSEGDRHSLAGEADQLLDQMLGIANTTRGGRYLFGGTVTDTPPFSLVDDGGGTRVVYGGNQDTLSVRVAPGIGTSLNLPGDSIFQARTKGSTVFEGMTGAAPSGAADNGAGFQSLEVSFNGLHTDAPTEITAGSGSTTALGSLSYTFTSAPNTLSIDGGPALSIPATDQDFTTADGRTINLTVSGVPAVLSGTFTSKAGLSTDGGNSVVDVSDFTDTEVAVRNSFDGTVLNVDASGINQTGTERATVTGSFDVFTTLIAVRDILRNDSGDTPEEVAARSSSMLDEIDSAHENILDGLRELGFRSSSMDLLRSRVENMSQSSAESLSAVQDTDIAETILEMQKQDLAYQASLQIGARILQANLMSFLR